MVVSLIQLGLNLAQVASLGVGLCVATGRRIGVRDVGSLPQRCDGNC